MNLSYPVAKDPAPPLQSAPEPERTLTVGELIQKLQTFDPNMPVWANSWVIDVIPDLGFADSDRTVENGVSLIRLL